MFFCVVLNIRSVLLLLLFLRLFLHIVLLLLLAVMACLWKVTYFYECAQEKLHQELLQFYKLYCIYYYYYYEWEKKNLFYYIIRFFLQGNHVPEHYIQGVVCIWYTYRIQHWYSRKDAFALFLYGNLNYNVSTLTQPVSTIHIQRTTKKLFFLVLLDRI